MFVHRANRTEQLVDALATELQASSLASPFAAETIVVQGRGMERWLAMELSRRLGIWANPSFPFPRALVERAFAAVLGDPPEEARFFSPEVTTWAIARLLRRPPRRKAFAPIKAYLAADDDGVLRVQLARRLADLFDQYGVYRPDMVRKWDERGGDEFQGQLWHMLAEGRREAHTAARAQAFFSRIAASQGPIEGLPERLFVFGISALPPLHLEVLSALSRRVPVHLFLLSPSAQYWADIRDEREILRELRRANADAADAGTRLHLSEGNPLLASLGKLGRDFQRVLETHDDYTEAEAERYVDPGVGHMLPTLQSDMLHLRTRRDDADVPPLPLLEDDASIAVHACHGPMREVEVLRDQLLALLEADASLDPRDIIVMAPEIEVYAPMIEAVFGTGTSIPHRIADRSARTTHAIVDAFEGLLDVLSGRFSASSVLDALAAAPVCERFGIHPEDLATLRHWVAETGIRWGIDEPHRVAVGQPASDANTFRFGLDRLLLGYAVRGGGERMWRGALPYDDVEGGVADLAGRFADFCEALFAQRAHVATPRSWAEWREVLCGLLAALVAETQQDAHEHQALRRALSELADAAALAGFDEPIDLRSVRASLSEAVALNLPATGFLSGGVTFCQLVPMRSVPFRVVALLGMSDESFPRAPRPLGFDLMSQHPRIGDRSAREDDRQVFLEALLAARQHLLITYVGQSIHDGSPLPPSVLVSELLDRLGESFVPAALPADADSERRQAALREAIVVRHPLQPFSPRYFTSAEAELFSYSESHRDGARALCGPKQAPPPFLAGAVALPEDGQDEGPRDLSLLDLERWLKAPTKLFLQRRLGLYLGHDAEYLADREPIHLDALERYGLGDDLLSRRLRGRDLDEAFEAVRASGRLPHGVLGQCLYEDLRPGVEAIVDRATEVAGGPAAAPQLIELEIAGTRLRGHMRDLFPNGQVHAQYSKIGRRSELVVWLRHLLLQVSTEGPQPSYLVGRGRVEASACVRFSPVAEARAKLGDLVELYWACQLQLVPLFPDASRAYVEAMRDPKKAKRAFELAQGKMEIWSPKGAPWGEAHDAYIKKAFPDPQAMVTPGEESFDFPVVAEKVYGPLLAHREEL